MGFNYRDKCTLRKHRQYDWICFIGQVAKLQLVQRGPRQTLYNDVGYEPELQLGLTRKGFRKVSSALRCSILALHTLDLKKAFSCP